MILTNLIQNSIKYAPSGSSIEVFVELSDHLLSIVDDPVKLKISVTDQGQGIPEEVQAKLFSLKPSGQAYLPKQTKNVMLGHESNGLGLNISKTIAQKLGGDLVYKKQDLGSCFSLTL